MGDEDGRQIPEQYAAELAHFYQAHAQWLAGHAYLRTSGTGTSPRPGSSPRTWSRTRSKPPRVPGKPCGSWSRSSSAPGCGTRCGIRTPISSAAVRRGASSCLSCSADTRPQEPDPEQQALSALALEKTARLIEGLPHEQRVIALMKWNDHMTEAEIAATLGCARGDVTAQVRKIRRKLIDGLGPFYPFAEDAGERRRIMIRPKKDSAAHVRADAFLGGLIPQITERLAATAIRIRRRSLRGAVRSMARCAH